MEEKKVMKNRENYTEQSGNVSSISEPYTNKNGKTSLKFDLARDVNGEKQYVPIILKGEMYETYGQVIQKGDWLDIKGKLNMYNKTFEEDGKQKSIKTCEIFAFDIYDKTKDVNYKFSNKEEKTLTDDINEKDFEDNVIYER